MVFTFRLMGMFPHNRTLYSGERNKKDFIKAYALQVPLNASTRASRAYLLFACLGYTRIFCKQGKQRASGHENPKEKKV